MFTPYFMNVLGTLAFSIMPAAILLAWVMKTDKYEPEPKIHPFASGLIEVYNFIQAPISFMIAVTGGNYVYALTLLAFLIVTILTVSLSATIMYIKSSSENNLRYLFNKLVNERIPEPPKETL